MSAGRDVKELEKKIGYRFRDPDLLVSALIHSSYANEMKGKIPGIKSNERLEFLGDAVLEEIVSRHLYDAFPDDGEGKLTLMRKSLVCESSLASAARTLSLGDYLCLGHGEEMQGSRDLDSILADSTEALIAAIRLDGGIEEAEKLIRRIILSRECADADYKTRLQQLVQQDGIEELSYRVVREKGPEHSKVFEVEAMINSNPVGRGVGKSKRDAEQNAAREALRLFGVHL
ncbi:MAG: ribonuclease III [Clostridia bacterium]|nr:ribonuclease III [Clostridia bacterium]